MYVCRVNVLPILSEVDGRHGNGQTKLTTLTMLKNFFLCFIHRSNIFVPLLVTRCLYCCRLTNSSNRTRCVAKRNNEQKRNQSCSVSHSFQPSFCTLPLCFLVTVELAIFSLPLLFWTFKGSLIYCRFF